MDQAQSIFDNLWKDYISQNPDTKKIYDLFVNEGEIVQNDHIAFRTFNHPKISISVLAQPFIDAGYQYSGTYVFEEKKLIAEHYEHKTNEKAPKVFISALLMENFSDFLQKTVLELIEKIPDGFNDSSDFLHSGNLWGNPAHSTYLKLQAESEYAAWLYVYGFRANHFTVNVNELQKFQDIYKLNQYLRDHGFVINESGGEVKGSPEELLEQSSIRAGKISIQFEEGIFNIPSCYYEFAKRYPDSTGKLYNGFIAKSADKIFESTDNIQ